MAYMAWWIISDSYFTSYQFTTTIHILIHSKLRQFPLCYLCHCMFLTFRSWDRGFRPCHSIVPDQDKAAWIDHTNQPGHPENMRILLCTLSVFHFSSIELQQTFMVVHFLLLVSGERKEHRNANTFVLAMEFEIAVRKQNAKVQYPQRESKMQWICFWTQVHVTPLGIWGNVWARVILKSH